VGGTFWLAFISFRGAIADTQRPAEWGISNRVYSTNGVSMRVDIQLNYFATHGCVNEL
jgi:hypothetical protein